MKKHGIDCFYPQLLEYVDITGLTKAEAKIELLKREQSFLDTLNPFGKNGFNLAKIAGSTLGYTFKGRRKTPKPYKHTKDAIERRSGRNSWFNKSVCKFDLTGKLLNTYFNVTEAAKQHNTSMQSIIKCCKRKQKTADGFLWTYKNEQLFIPAPHKSKSVGMFDINTNKLIQTFINAKQAGEYCKTNANPIYRCCRGEQPTALGFIWKFL